MSSTQPSEEPCREPEIRQRASSAFATAAQARRDATAANPTRLVLRILHDDLLDLDEQVGDLAVLLHEHLDLVRPVLFQLLDELLHAPVPPRVDSAEEWVHRAASASA